MTQQVRPRFWRDGSMQFFAVLVAGLAILVSPVAHRHLPARFVIDGQYIQGLMHSAAASPEPNSFDRVAAIYEAIGLGNSQAIIGMIGIVLFTMAVFLATPFREVSRYGIVAAIMYVCGFACALAYLAQYSKETLTLGVIVLLLVKPDKKSAEALFVAACILYAAVVRPYWFIVLALYLFWRVALRIRAWPWWLVVGFLVAFYVALQVVFSAVTGDSLADIRGGVNAYRSGMDVDTLISSPIPLEGLLAGPAGVVMVASLVVPIPLLLTGGAVHGMGALLIGFLWGCAGAGFLHYRRRLAASAPPTRRDHLMGRAVALVFAFVMVQAVFEPDYGSYLKHLTPLLPVFLALVPTRSDRRARIVAAAEEGNVA